MSYNILDMIKWVMSYYKFIFLSTIRVRKGKSTVTNEENPEKNYIAMSYDLKGLEVNEWVLISTWKNQCGPLGQDESCLSKSST
jgi:hypothetical protein